MLHAVFPAVGPVYDDGLGRIKDADVVLFGEVHDNPQHHIAQTEIVAALQPRGDGVRNDYASSGKHGVARHDCRAGRHESRLELE